METPVLIIAAVLFVLGMLISAWVLVGSCMQMDGNTGFLQGVVELRPDGYVAVRDEIFTSVPGLFAAGDVADPIYRQLSTSVGAGTRAASVTISGGTSNRGLNRRNRRKLMEKQKISMRRRTRPNAIAPPSSASTTAITALRYLSSSCRCACKGKAVTSGVAPVPTANVVPQLSQTCWPLRPSKSWKTTKSARWLSSTSTTAQSAP